MDDLDRLYRRLVLTVRDGAPHLLDRQFRLGDVAVHLVPYRHTRRELGFESIQEYETALMRLASGERGYLRADAPVQAAMRQALAGPQPDAGALRAHADALVALPPDALARAGLEPASGTRDGAGAARETPAGARPRGTGELAAVPAPDVADLERAVLASSQASTAWSELARPVPPATSPAHAPRPTTEPPPPMQNPHAAQVPSSRSTVGASGTCRYCGQQLPEGRRVTFCPYCGNNLTVLQCPACSTELEVGWRFCITCGRAMDESAFAAPPEGAGGGGAGR